MNDSFGISSFQNKVWYMSYLFLLTCDSIWKGSDHITNRLTKDILVYDRKSLIYHLDLELSDDYLFDSFENFFILTSFVKNLLSTSLISLDKVTAYIGFTFMTSLNLFWNSFIITREIPLWPLKQLPCASLICHSLKKFIILISKLEPELSCSLCLMGSIQNIVFPNETSNMQLVAI